MEMFRMSLSLEDDDAQLPTEDAQNLITSLPRELQTLILHQVYGADHTQYLAYLGDGDCDPTPLTSLREQLKPLRLISRIFHDAVTPIIFASIHLHASELSLRRAEQIANSRLAGHVREIVSHEGSFAYADTEQAKFLKILNSHRRRQDYPKSFQFLNDGVLYQNYLQEIHAAKHFDGFEVVRMTALLKRLYRCITFTPLPGTTQWCDPRKSAYTLRRTGLAYPPRLGVRPKSSGDTSSFIESIVQWKPKVLNLANFTYESTCKLVDVAFKTRKPIDETPCTENWAGQLMHLKLGWLDDARWPDGESINVSEYAPMLTLLMQRSYNLVSLELTHGFDISPQFPLFPEDGLPNLKHLTISRGSMDGRWAEGTLANFIQHLGKTIKHLHFDNIRLQRGTDRESLRSRNEGCLLRLLFNITPYVNLESCTGLNTVTDYKTILPLQHTFVRQGHKPGREVILQKVQDVVCGRRAWPTGWNMANLPTMFDSFVLDDIPFGVEAAFVFSSWEDTVDPWSEPQRVDSMERARKELMKYLIDDDEPVIHEPAKKKGPKVFQSAKPLKVIGEKRGKIKKILGLS